MDRPTPEYVDTSRKLKHKAGFLARCRKAGKVFEDTPAWDSIVEYDVPAALQWYWRMVDSEVRGRVSGPWRSYAKFKAFGARLNGRFPLDE